MRTGGFPCRLVGCLRSFAVADQTSMDALRAASAARSAHEIADHDYHHVVLGDTGTAGRPWSGQTIPRKS